MCILGVCCCREELQEAQWEAAKANLVPCRNCQRRFAPDRVRIHERACKGDKKPRTTAARDTGDDDVHVTGQYRGVNFDNFDKNSNPNDVPRSRNGPMNSRGKHLEVLFCKCRHTTWLVNEISK